MESHLPLDSEARNFEITTESREYLLEAAKWGRFIAIVGFVFVVLFLLMVTFMGRSIMSQMSEAQGQEGLVVLSGTFWFLYTVFIFVMFFFPSLYTYKFSVKTIRALKSTSIEDLAEGLKNLKSLFKFYGVLIIIILAFYALIIGGGMLGALLV